MEHVSLQSSVIPRSDRLASIDIVRGIAMVIMLISHSTWSVKGVSFRLHYGWDIFGQVQVNTHPEAWVGLLEGSPIFFLLMGYGVALFEASKRRKGWTEWEITRFLLIRGMLLLTLDLFILPWDIYPKLAYAPHVYFVLAALGICMCAVAFLRRLPIWQLGLVALGLTLGTQIIYKAATIPTDVNLLRALFLYPSPVETVAFGFPVLAWLPVVLLGFVSAQWVIQKKIDLQTYALRIGIGLLALWGVIVLLNNFGRLYTESPFIQTKHPPMLDFLSLYLGFAFLLVYVFNRYPSLENYAVTRTLSLLGKTSLFYYISHFYVLMVVSFGIKLLHLPGIITVFLIIGISLGILYFLCRRYWVLRQKYPNSILQYL